MTTSRLAPLGAGIVAVAVGAALLLTTPTAAVAAPQTEGLQYVALGDSYAAGYGILPGTGLPVPGCDQGQQNYPHQIAAALGLQLTDVTCTGAVTANIVDTPQTNPPYFGGGTANPQSQALSAETDVVTVSIGGNDAGFSFIAESCLAETDTGNVLGPGPSYNVPYLSQPTCQAAFAAATPVIDLAANVAGPVTTNLAAAYADIRAKAPNAKVFVVGYPSIFPAVADGCFTPAFDSNGYLPNSVPFQDSDIDFIHGIEVQLNQVIAAQAAAAGFTFIDNQPASLDHSVCPQGPESYINGVTVQSLTQEPYTAPGALHPNALGVTFLTNQTVPAIAAAFPAPSPTPTPTPAPITAAPQLAESGGTASAAPLALGAALLLGGAAAIVATRVRARRG